MATALRRPACSLVVVSGTVTNNATTRPYTAEIYGWVGRAALGPHKALFTACALALVELAGLLQAPWKITALAVRQRGCRLLKSYRSLSSGGTEQAVTQPFRIFILILTAVWLPGNVIKRRVRRPASFWRGSKT